MNILKPTFEYTGNSDQPISFRIIESDPSPEHLNSLITQISDLERQLSSSQSQVISLSTENQTLSQKIETQSKEIQELSLALQQTIDKNSKDLKSLNKKLKESEKINLNHFALIEELKQKYQDDYKLKSADLEKKIIDLQKTLNLKANQVFKLSQVLKDKENKRSSAEIMLDELEKKNTEFIEKNAKSEKNIFDLEKKVNELNKRIVLLTAEVKSSDEINVQRDQQMKKLMSKIKAQELEMQRLEEDLKVKEKKIMDLQKGSKAQNTKIDAKQIRNSKVLDDPKKVLELLASKDEELNLMKEMLKSMQNKHPSPASSNSKFVKNSKLPPIIASGSVKDLKSEIPKHRDIFKVKTNFKIREIDTKVGKKQHYSSPNLPKSVGTSKFPVSKQILEDSPLKSSKNTEVYEETPKFGEGTGSNFPDIKVTSLENVIDEVEENGSIVGKIKIFDNKDEFENNEESDHEENKNTGWDVNENIEEKKRKEELIETEEFKKIEDLAKNEEFQYKDEGEGNEKIEIEEVKGLEIKDNINTQQDPKENPEEFSEGPKELEDDIQDKENIEEFQERPKGLEDDTQQIVHKESLKNEVNDLKTPEKIETEIKDLEPQNPKSPEDELV